MLIKDSKKEIVYESPTRWDRPFIWWYLKRGYRIWVIEPVYAYHYTKKVHFFPRYLPVYVNALIESGKIGLLSIEQLSTKYIFFEAGDKAVETVESVFVQYRRDHNEMFKYVTEMVQSKVAENAFKADFCNRLAEFYSMNMFIGRVSDSLKDKAVIFYPRYDLWAYTNIRKAVDQCGIAIFNGHNIQFPLKSWVSGFIKNMREKLTVSAKILTQYLGCLFRKESGLDQSSGKKKYLLGIAISSPERQLRGNQRGPDFLIDHQKIHPEDVVYFCRDELNSKQKQHLEKLPGNYCLIPRLARFFSHKHVWKKLLRFVISKNFLTNAFELQVAQLVLFNYFVWKNILQRYEIKNFTTHCDFGAPHIGRNIAFNQAGTQTWYYTDSMNFTGNFRQDDSQNGWRHPFWTYFYYDHFVTWADFIIKYFKEHHMSIPQYHLVGCLWSDGLIMESKNAYQKNQKFTIGAFDTGYTLNGIGCHEEGMVFADHLIKLVEEFPDIDVVLKGKFDRINTKKATSHKEFDLSAQYQKMNQHPRINVLSDQVAPSEIIIKSDLIVSFPFTSTTFEALSINKPAIWHDPMDFYRNTFYGRIPNVVTHGYAQLRECVLQYKSNIDQEFKNPIPSGSPMLDPFRDGKALHRFRKLLV